jgi:hypothetical protein
MQKQGLQRRVLFFADGGDEEELCPGEQLFNSRPN